MVTIEQLRRSIAIAKIDVPRILRDVADGRAHPSQGDFIVNRLASLQDQLAEQLEAERAIIVVDIIPQPIEPQPPLDETLIPVVIPTTQQTTIFSLTVKQIAVLIGIGVLIL